MDSHRNELINLIENNVVTAENLDSAVSLANITPSSARWLSFLSQLCLWIGSTALGLSVLFFIAFNWLEFGRFAKFALVEISLVAAVVCYLFFKATPLLAKASITVASILVGVLLALFGQTYQTGADPWQLFVIWACLILPWAMTARFSVLWLICLVLCNTSFALYVDVHNRHLIELFWQDAGLWGLFAINLLSLIIWQLASQKMKWLQDGFSERIIAVTVAVFITILALISVENTSMLNNLALPIWALCMGLACWVYRYKTIDLFMLAIGCLSGIIVVVGLCVSLLFNSGDIVGAFLLLTIIVVGLGAVAAKWLNSLHKLVHQSVQEQIQAPIQEPGQKLSPELAKKEVQHDSE